MKAKFVYRTLLPVLFGTAGLLFFVYYALERPLTDSEILYALKEDPGTLDSLFGQISAQSFTDPEPYVLHCESLRCSRRWLEELDEPDRDSILWKNGERAGDIYYVGSVSGRYTALEHYYAASPGVRYEFYADQDRTVIGWRREGRE